MNFLPDWAPGIHPLVIHFPIALFFAAVAFDAASAFVKKLNYLTPAGVYLYIATAIFAIVSFFSGKDAADALDIPAFAVSSVNEHANLATYFVWFIGIYAMVRMALLLNEMSGKIFRIVALAVAGVGLFLLFETAEHGGELVYEYGLGVQAVQQLESDKIPEVPYTPAPLTQLISEENGSWFIEIADEPIRLFSTFDWLKGTVSDANLNVSTSQANENLITMDLANADFMFTAGGTQISTQAEVKVNLEAFDGVFSLLHHVVDAQNYFYVKIEDGKMIEGYVSAGGNHIMKEAPVNLTEWNIIKAQGDAGHFKGILNGELITHGHASGPAPGKVGLQISGTGLIQFAGLSATALK